MRFVRRVGHWFQRLGWRIGDFSRGAGNFLLRPVRWLGDHLRGPVAAAAQPFRWLRSLPGRARDRAGAAARAVRAAARRLIPDRVADGFARLRTWIAGVVERLRESPRAAAAAAGAATLVVLYVGWLVYVTASEGTTAGLGVLLSWPLLLLAIALVALPFIGVGLLVSWVVRKARGSGGSDDETNPGEETITTNTFPA